MHHDAITGTSKQYVINDYQFRLQKGIDDSSNEYKKELSRIIKNQYGFNIKASDILRCQGQQNDTVQDCPVNAPQNKEKQEFMVIVHNSQGRSVKQLLRVLLPQPNYKVQVWNGEKKAFVDTVFDVVEQTHFHNNAPNSTDFLIFAEANLKADEIKMFKIVKTKTRASLVQQIIKNKKVADFSLTVQGISDEGDAIFQFENKRSQLTQSFSVSVKKYLAHQMKTPEPNRYFLKRDDQTDEEKINGVRSEGMYSFIPEWNNQMPKQYSTLNDDITYQAGQLVEQWSLFFKNEKTNERGILKVRHSPLWQDLVEFELETTSIPIDDGQGKDITINWKMLDSFDPQGIFYSDSNGLEMQTRIIKNVSTPAKELALGNNDLGPSFLTISGHYFPIDSAIAMRDKSGLSNVQVTVMNDRSQGGSADLQKATIELMHARRILRDDNLGIEEVLNETDWTGMGARVATKYYMQIFDWTKGGSKQREQQINIDQSLQYLFAFNFDQDKAAKLTTPPKRKANDD